MNQILKQYGQFIINMGTIVLATACWIFVMLLGYEFLKYISAIIEG